MAEELLDACWEGDFRRAEILAGAGWAEEGEGDFVGVKDVRDWLGRTPLHLACRSGQLGESYNRLLSYASLRLFRPLLLEQNIFSSTFLLLIKNPSLFLQILSDC